MAAVVLPFVPWDDSPSLSGDRAMPLPPRCLPLSANKYFLHELVSRTSGDRFRIFFQPVKPSERTLSRVSSSDS